MECPSCGFQNIPGLTACGRCGTRLDLATATIDVSPPRASKAARRVRKLVPRRGAYAVRDAARELVSRGGSSLIETGVPIPEPGVFARLIVPGWAHFHEGDRLRGWLFLAPFLFLLVLGLIGWGTPEGTILLGLAFSVHATAALNVVVRGSRMAFPSLFATSAIYSLVLGLVLYLPCFWALNHLASYREIQSSLPPFEANDVVLVNEWGFGLRSPRPGDVVLFRAWDRRSPLGPQDGHRRVVIEENELIDRILAGPGDQVEWADGKLTVNGVESSWRPLNPEKLPSKLSIHVPDDHYLILPTVSRVTSMATPAFDWVEAGCIRRDQIEGRAYLRNHPLSRWWFLR